MSVYALIDPRTKVTRYVGRSHLPRARLKGHLRRAHTLALRDWIGELRAAGMCPELRVLDGGTEREWIVRLRPDLNSTQGDEDDPAGRPKGFNIRSTPEEIKEWEWGAKVFAEETSTDENVSAFLRAAAKEKIKRYREAKKNGR